MIEQIDDRQLFGFKSDYSSYHNVGSLLARATLGGSMRGDDTDVGLWKNTVREREYSLRRFAGIRAQLLAVGPRGDLSQPAVAADAGAAGRLLYV